MKAKTLFIQFIFISFSISVYAQADLAMNNREEPSCEKYCILELFPESDITAPENAVASEASFLFDGGSVFLPVRDNCLAGVSFSMGGANEDFASAFSFDGIFSHNINFPSADEVISPHYKYLFFGWDNQYFIHPKNKITLALDLRFGWGYECFSDKSKAGDVFYYQLNDTSSYYTDESYYSYGTIASDNMFVIEPGMNFLFKVSRCVSIGAGAHSRIVLGINTESPLGDTGFYSGNIFLRFRIFGKNA